MNCILKYEGVSMELRKDVLVCVKADISKKVLSIGMRNNLFKVNTKDVL